MEQWSTLQYLQAGAYIAIMLAVLGVPQMLSSYFDLRARRQAEDRQREERRQAENRQKEERRQDEERRREERRQDAEAAERRHHELMALMVAALGNGRNQGSGQSELIRNLQQTIEDLQAENERLRQQNGNGDSSP